MSESQTPASSPSFFSRLPVLFLPAYLILNLLWRVFTPAHEYPMRPEQVLEMSIDALAIIGMFGVRRRMPAWVFWIAVVAGVGLFAIRLTSDASWWTGHVMYWLPPR
ncbi:MAG TPA: hypothetical protein VGC38_03420 [Pseudolabrys sp.]